MTDLDEQTPPEPAAPGTCPVCDRHTEQEAIASQQIIFMGLKAVLDHDDQMVEDVFANIAPYDAHVAIGLLMLALGDISAMTGTPLALMIEQYQKQLTNAQHEASEEE